MRRGMRKVEVQPAPRMRISTGSNIDISLEVGLSIRMVEGGFYSDGVDVVDGLMR